MVSKEKQLSKFFILEVFASCLRKSSVFEIGLQHIQYHFFPSQEYKSIWKAMVNYYQLNNRLVTLGVLSQQFVADKDVTEVLNKISKIDPPTEDVIIDQMEIFIKKMIFIDTHRELAEKYSNRDDEGAYSLMVTAAERLASFSIKNRDSYNNIIEGMPSRIESRRDAVLTSPTKITQDKIPTGIMLELDTQLKGGINRGDTFLWMAPSGGGKSKAMKYSGYYNSKIGNRVVHIQGEGTLKQAEEEYDTAFIGSDISSVETGMLSQETEKELLGVLSQIKAKGGEIHIKAYEQFGLPSMADVRRFCYEIIKVYGPIDLLLVDYLELFDPGDGKFYKEERFRREAIANMFKNLCVEINCAGITATQSMDIPHTLKNDSKFVLKREHISEFKGMVKPFSYFVTINGTDKELENNIRRIHIDKWRKYKVVTPTFSIGTNFDNERFYDNMSTQLLARYGKTE